MFLSSILRSPASGSPLATWVHTPHPFLIQFGENAGIRYYGLAYLLGFVFGAWMFRLYFKAGRTPLNPAASMDLMLYLVIGVMVGGRLGSYLLYDGWRSFGTDPLGVFKVWQGGMASHGGFVGVLLAIVWFARQHKVKLLHLCDLVASTAPCGLFLGRLANYLNGELWGKVTDGTWGVIFQGAGNFPRHPSQLYEAVLEGALLLAYGQWRFWRTDAPVKQPGRLCGEFLIGYAVARIICEVFREPDVFIPGESTLILGLSRGTFLSFFIAAGGIWLIRLSSRKAA